MNFFRGRALVPVALLAVSTLTACAPEREVVPEVPSTNDLIGPSNPALDKDAELAHAMEVIRSYNTVVFQIASDYSVDASVLSPFGTSEMVEEMRRFQDGLRSRGQHLVGENEIKKAVLQDVDPRDGTVTVLTCEAMDEVRVIDAAGADVTPPDRGSTATMQTVLVDAGDGLRVKRSDEWPGSSIC